MTFIPYRLYDRYKPDFFKPFLGFSQGIVLLGIRGDFPDEEYLDETQLEEHQIKEREKNLLHGATGQYSYNGPYMHESEIAAPSWVKHHSRSRDISGELAFGPVLWSFIYNTYYVNDECETGEPCPCEDIENNGHETDLSWCSVHVDPHDNPFYTWPDKKPVIDVVISTKNRFDRGLEIFKLLKDTFTQFTVRRIPYSQQDDDHITLIVTDVVDYSMDDVDYGIDVEVFKDDDIDDVIADFTNLYPNHF